MAILPLRATSGMLCVQLACPAAISYQRRLRSGRLFIVKERRESVVHMQLLMAVKESWPGVVCNKIDVGFLITAKHDDISLKRPRRNASAPRFASTSGETAGVAPRSGGGFFMASPPVGAQCRRTGVRRAAGTAHVTRERLPDAGRLQPSMHMVAVGGWTPTRLQQSCM
jgi:hypothetical protein